MADKLVSISVPTEKPIKVSKWKVKEGNFVSQGQILFLYNECDSSSSELRKFKATKAGTISSIKVQDGGVVEPGCPVLEVAACKHPTVMKDLCAECGADLRADDAPQVQSAVVPMIHSVPELKVSEELARKLGKEDTERLLRDRKLVLLVDLDQTLVHTTNENIPPNVKGVSHYFLRGLGGGGGGGGRWYHTRLRPGTRAFLQSAAARYELHVCTFGARQYAHAVAALLDPHHKYFSHRILSRDECFDPRTKAANLKALFPCGDNMVCIIDDREDVWGHAANLIHVRPYNFFHCTGDINAPPALPGPPPAQGPQAQQGPQGPRAQCPQPPQQGAAEEKRLPTGKNGAQKSVNNEMPILDFEDSQPKLEQTEKSMNIQEENGIITQKQKEISRPNTDTNPVINIDEILGIDDDSTNLDSSDSDDDSIKKDNVSEKQVTSVKEVESSEESKLQTEEISKSVEGSSKSEEVVKEKGAERVGKEQKENINAMLPEQKWTETADGEIEVEDPDDYLIYLDDILQRIHKYFYEQYDRLEAGSVPDLKRVIPEVRGRVLAGASLVFSGLVPTHQRLESSRAYHLARSLGAEVTQDLTPRTTHLVAVRPGTAKVNASRRLVGGGGGGGKGALHVVTSAWLWTCAERWERVDERLYPLQRATAAQAVVRRPPAHCGSPVPAGGALAAGAVAAVRRRTPSGRFMDTLNPLLSFSSDDIADMDREVEDIFNESDESSSDGDQQTDDLDDEENPSEDRLISAEAMADDSSQDDKLLPDDLELSSSSDDDTTGRGEAEEEEGRARKRPRRSSPRLEPPDSNAEDSNSTWNMLGATLEREFLANSPQ